MKKKIIVISAIFIISIIIVLSFVVSFINDRKIKERREEIKQLIINYLEDKYNLISKKDAIHNVHIPNDLLYLKKARQRIKAFFGTFE